MAITFLSGSYQDDLETRVSNAGGNGGGLAGRVTSCESRLDELESSEGTSTADLPENMNVVSTLLGALTAAVNATNAKVNQHNDVFVAKGWLT